MAEDEEASKEEAEALPEEQEKGPGRPRRTVEKPVSLYPLNFEEAIDALLAVKLDPEKKKEP